MKHLILIFICHFVVGCMLAPQPQNSQNRRFHSELSDLDNLEMLLLNDQQPIYQSKTHSPNDNLRLGMKRQSVEFNMGAPTEREVAGNPQYGNERWTYERSVPTLDGYYKEKKIIYFERGNVVGWESH